MLTTTSAAGAVVSGDTIGWLHDGAPRSRREAVDRLASRAYAKSASWLRLNRPRKRGGAPRFSRLCGYPGRAGRRRYALARPSLEVLKISELGRDVGLA